MESISLLFFGLLIGFVIGHLRTCYWVKQRLHIHPSKSLFQWLEER